MRRQTFSVVRRESAGPPDRERVEPGGSVRARAERAALRMAELERIAWREARDRCLQLEKIRRNAQRRVDALNQGSAERFLGERALAEMALREVARCEPRDSAAYTIVSFANLRDRLRFITGSDADRETLLRETLARGGVYDERGCFMEILR